MHTADTFASDIAFTETVKTIQQQRGSRRAYERMERGGSWQTTITPELREFIAAQTSVYLATANADGQPYVQHRGGPTGFLRVVDDTTIAFADFTGNRQYITTGNLEDNPKAHLFLMDYAQRQRVKIWGTATVESDPEMVRRLMPENYRAKADQAIVFKVAAWDSNCPQHIPLLYDEDQMRTLLAEKDRRIAALELELRRYR